MKLTNSPLYSLRAALGLSRRKFASRISVSVAYVHHVESRQIGMGKNSALATLEHFRAAMDENDITLEHLLRGCFAQERAA